MHACVHICARKCTYVLQVGMWDTYLETVYILTLLKYIHMHKHANARMCAYMCTQMHACVHTCACKMHMCEMCVGHLSQKQYTYSRLLYTYTCISTQMHVCIADGRVGHLSRNVSNSQASCSFIPFICVAYI